MGFVDLLVGFIVDIVLCNSIWQIFKVIDDLVWEQFDLCKIVEEVWWEMFQLALVFEEYNIWFIVNLQYIGMSLVFIEWGRIVIIIYVEGKFLVKIGECLDFKYIQFLLFLCISLVEVEDFILYINVEIFYDEVECFVKIQFVGEIFFYGCCFVMIQDLEFFGKGSNIVVNIILSGIYNGSIYLVGCLVFNFKKNIIDIEDLEYMFDIKNYLFWFVGWLMKSIIKNKIVENFNFLFDYNMKDMQV